MLWRSLARTVLRPSGKFAVTGTAQHIVPNGASATAINRLLSSQSESMPRLPVPKLDQTMGRLLGTVRPLVTDDEYNGVQQLVDDFSRQGGTGERLQWLLEQKASKTQNWLEDWWLNVAYLENRLPCAIHVNPGIMGPRQNFKDTDGQLRYAAKLTAGALEYKSSLDDGTVTIDKMGGKPLCMRQYFQILSSCRIPGVKHDSVYNPTAQQTTESKHITVMHNNNIFAVPVYGSDNRTLTPDQICEQFRNVVNQSSQQGPGLGIMTTENRNEWGKVYTKLVKDKQNKSNFDMINSSIFVLCLDKPVNLPGMDAASSTLHQVNNGGGTANNTGNRWFDKILQIIVSQDGGMGANYEHSTAEGPPVIAIFDHAIQYASKDHSGEPTSSLAPPPQKLEFNLTNDTLSAIKTAGERIDSLINDLELQDYTFTDFGKNTLKELKVSPDAFIQIALQLAYYRLYGHSAATYESGSLRMFKHGRTDTIRTCSVQSHTYCQAVVNRDLPDPQRGRMLREALKAHRAYTDAVISGQGIDRHLLGLKLTAVENGMDVPKLFMDPVYNSSGHWTLSTSQVPSKMGVMCYGPAVPDGYGCCYNPRNTEIQFALSAWNSSPVTSTQKIADSLRQALLEGRKALESSAEQKL